MAWGQHEAEHSQTAGKRKARIIGYGKTSGRSEALEMKGRGKANARTTNQHAVVQGFRRNRGGRSRRPLLMDQSIGDAGPVISYSHFDRRFFESEGQRVG